MLHASTHFGEIPTEAEFGKRLCYFRERDAMKPRGGVTIELDSAETAGEIEREKLVLPVFILYIPPEKFISILLLSVFYYLTIISWSV